MQLLDDPRAMYERATDSARRELNDAFYHAIYVAETDISRADLTAVFKEFTDAYEPYGARQRAMPNQNRRHIAVTPAKGVDTLTDLLTLRDAVKVTGSSKAVMVDLLETYSGYMSTLDQLVRLERDLQTMTPRAVQVTASTRRRPSRPRFSEEQRASLIADYQAGASTTELANTYSIGKDTVLKVLREAGIQVRWPRMTEQEIQRAARLYERGLSLVDVGKQLGRGHSTVYQALRRHGVKMRDPHGRQ